jgi:short-subunit dehydrogenase
MTKLNIEYKKIAIVTGSSRGIGLSIAKKLLDAGYTVVGCCRNPELCRFTHPNFQLDCVDLTSPKQIEQWIEKLKSFEQIELLIHNAGQGFFAPMEELQWTEIQTMIALHLTAPMLITNSLLRHLKKLEGRIIFIGSVAGTQVSPWGSVYGATKAGLIHLGRELFQELRKSGVKVTNIIPDLTDTDFYHHLNFQTDEDPKSYLLSECIATAVESIINQREGTVISEIVIQPERFKIKKKK